MACSKRASRKCGFALSIPPGNTKGRSIIVPLTSCLTGLDSSVLQIKTKIVSCHTAYSKPVKQEVNRTVILPPLVFPDSSFIHSFIHSFIQSVSQSECVIILYIVSLSVARLCVIMSRFLIMESVIMPNAVMPNVVAPYMVVSFLLKNVSEGGAGLRFIITLLLKLLKVKRRRRRRKELTLQGSITQHF
jgi:hypothetical protein